MSRKINIAIDGYSSCGKGTLARMLASELGYVFIDTGAMYRALTLAILRSGSDMHDRQALAQILKESRIGFTLRDGKPVTLLNGIDVEQDIRSMEVSEMVSPVSQIPEVRTCLVGLQQAMGTDKGVVMDGRDIGTVVFPDAELKVFMTARPEIRARRRFEELRSKGDTDLTYEEVLANINTRDRLDSDRSLSPLRIAEGAFVLDNSAMSREEQLQIVLQKARAIIGGV